MDLVRLKHDIMKYAESGVLEVSEFAWWREFYDAFEVKYGFISTNSPPPSLLESLQKIRASTSAPPMKQLVVPEKIQSIYLNQMENKSEV